MLLVPDFGFLFDSYGLGVGHAGSQDLGKRFAVGVSGGAGQDGPEVGLGQTGGDAAASPVTSAERGLGFYISILGCFEKPVGGFLVILLHAVARGVTSAQGIFGRRFSFVGELAELVEGCSFDGRDWWNDSAAAARAWKLKPFVRQFVRGPGAFPESMGRGCSRARER